MKSVRSFTMFGCLALALSAGLASAQTASGNFTLPFEAHWGLATLPAGDYSFKLDRVNMESVLEVYQGMNAVALIRAQTCNSSNDRTGRSELTVTQNKAGNDLAVTALRLAPIGAVFTFAPHKPKQGTSPEERQVARMIPVNTAGQ